MKAQFYCGFVFITVGSEEHALTPDEAREFYFELGRALNTAQEGEIEEKEKETPKEPNSKTEALMNAARHLLMPAETISVIDDFGPSPTLEEIKTVNKIFDMSTTRRNGRQLEEIQASIDQAIKDYAAGHEIDLHDEDNDSQCD